MLPNNIQALFTGNDPVALAVWFLASIGLVIVVTFIYVFVLNKSPPPEGETVARQEKMQQELVAVSSAPSTSSSLSSILSQIHSAMLASEYPKAVELCVYFSSSILGSLLRSNGGDPTNMSISDLAFLIQSKAKISPQISEPMYQLNLIRLKAAQGQPITKEEAEWAVSVANWVGQLVQTKQISFA
ncbi:MAG TPA: hypothetical protein VFF30_04835 [Nitrososphaerales archaeon]|nr:hypothetical protein [Nitrososphaerales archaeon]